MGQRTVAATAASAWDQPRKTGLGTKELATVRRPPYMGEAAMSESPWLAAQLGGLVFQ